MRTIIGIVIRGDGVKMLFDLNFFIALVLFVFSLVLTVAPAKNVGVVNFVIGFVTVAVGASVAMGFTGATELVEQYFMICVALVGVMCMLNADGVRK